MMALFISIVSHFGIKEKEAERFFKFGVVGTIGFIVDFGTLTFLVELLGFHPLVANTISFSAAVVSNFTFNRYWTYPDSRSKRRRIQLLQFAVVSIVGLALNNSILVGLRGPFNSFLPTIGAPPFIDGYIPAKIVATVVVLFWNFFINRYWTYNDVD
ncbi:MAG TPA: GtrA family protein [Candidatus Sulfomarinibacteraceae bacterium]|nr:GtrA family protein [Candidatus Sulfomarinibacteraceae bacterium]